MTLIVDYSSYHIHSFSTERMDPFVDLKILFTKEKGLKQKDFDLGAGVESF